MSDDNFEWQKAQEDDMREIELQFALRIARGKTSITDAISYLQERGWRDHEIAQALMIRKECDSRSKQLSLDL